MPTKPTSEVMRAFDKFKNDPKFSHDVVESIINDNPTIRQGLIDAGLAEEVRADA